MDAEIDLEGVAEEGKPGEVELVATAKELRLPILGQRPGSPHSLKYTFMVFKNRSTHCSTTAALQLGRHDSKICIFLTTKM